MNTIYIIRAIPYEEDSRILRYKMLFKANNINVCIIQWGGMDSDKVKRFFIHRFRGKPFINLFLTPLFSIWVLLTLVFLKEKKITVLSIDLDTGFPVAIAKIFKDIKFIYDIADTYSLCRFNKNIKMINTVESIVAKLADFSVLPGESRKVFYDKNINFYIIENVPLFNKIMKKEKRKFVCSKKLHIGYFGNIEPDVRFLEDLADIALKRNDLVIHIAGTGGLEGFFMELSLKEPDKVKFYGKYKHNDLIDLSESIDIFFAAYNSKKEHHNFIESNKSYEHLFLGIGILTNNGTNLAEKIRCWDTGWIFEENKNAINIIIDYIQTHRFEVMKKNENARRIWNNLYSSYWENDENVKKIIKFIQKC